MNYYKFRAEFMNTKTGKKETRVIYTRSNSLSGAMRKVHQDHEGINVISIFD